MLFTNTGAETAETYAFVARLFSRIEAAGLACLNSEFATCEVERGGLDADADPPAGKRAAADREQPQRL